MKQKDFLLIAIFTFLTVLAWIVLTIYHARVTSTISTDLKEKIKPIEPRFDISTVEMLKTQRKSVNLLPEALPASPSPTLKMTETQSATFGGQAL